MKQKNRKAIVETKTRTQKVEVYPPAQSYERVVVDETAWLLLIDPDCRDKPVWPETLARHLYEIKEAIKQGPEGVRLAVESIDEGIRIAYEYTPIHRAALRLFYVHIAGELVGDGPQELLDGVVDETITRRGSQRVDMPEDLT
jgi:hypothetical protein